MSRINDDCAALNHLLDYDIKHAKNLDAQHIKQTKDALSRIAADLQADPGGTRAVLQHEASYIKARLEPVLKQLGLSNLEVASFTPVGPINPYNTGRGPGGRGPGDGGQNGRGAPGEEPTPTPTPTPEPTPEVKPPGWTTSDTVDISPEAAEAIGELTAAGYLLWEVAKWGAAVAAAPETAGGSLAGAAVAP